MDGRFARSSGRGARLWRVRLGAAPRSRSEFDSLRTWRVTLLVLPLTIAHKRCDGARPILENSTACQIIDANYLVSGLAGCAFFGVWLVGFGVNYPLVETNGTALLLVDSASAGFRILHGFK